MSNCKRGLASTGRWLLAVVLSAVLPACGGDGGGGNAALPTVPGAGGGVGGAGRGPAPVNLGAAGNFVILAKSGVSTTGTTSVVGNLGISPIDGTGFTGFSESMYPGNEYAVSAVVVGKMYAADYAPPTPSNLTTAVSDMQTAYTDAAGRAADYTELGAGSIGGLNLGPATYKWSTGVLIPTNVTLTGGFNDVWIFQIAGDLTVSSGVQVILAGGALPQNVYWQTFGAVALDTTSQFNGVILSQTSIVMRTGASINGRALAQTAVTLDANPVTAP